MSSWKMQQGHIFGCHEFLLKWFHEEGESVSPFNQHRLSFFNSHRLFYHLGPPKFAMHSNISRRIEKLLCDALGPDQGCYVSWAGRVVGTPDKAEHYYI